MNTNSKLTEEQTDTRNTNNILTRERVVEHAKDYLRRFDELPYGQQDEMSPFGFRSHLICVLSYESEIASLREQLAAANNGKTLRDEIAIAVMKASVHALISNDPDVEIYKPVLTADAYDYADAMLKARGEGQ